MPPGDELRFVVELYRRSLLQDFALMARRQFLAIREATEKVRRRNDMWGMVNSTNARIDNLSVTPKRRASQLELMHRDMVFKRHGINAPSTSTIIKVPDYASPWEQERSRLAMNWYNTRGIEPANSAAARAYTIYTYGSYGLMEVWLTGLTREPWKGGGVASTGPTIFDLLDLPGGIGARPELPTSFPKMEQYPR